MRIAHTVAALGFFAMTSGIVFAQHYGSAGAAARAPLPSSTAIGAGALSYGPSSTARSGAPSFGFTRPYGGSYSYNRNNSYTNYYRNYRTLPRGYVIAPYYYPSFDWTGGTDTSAAASPPYDPSDQGYGPDPATDALLRSQAALGAQVQRLTDQMNGLMYGPGPGYPQAPAAAQEQTPQTPPITIVLRNGEHLQVQNYAVSADTFWDFTQHGTRKIPMSTIDVPASQKATEAGGGEFPSLGNGQ